LILTEAWPLSAGVSPRSSRAICLASSSSIAGKGRISGFSHSILARFFFFFAKRDARLAS
jgi:hypothetical protein